MYTKEIGFDKVENDELGNQFISFHKEMLIAPVRCNKRMWMYNLDANFTSSYIICV